jgi:O-antigen ligase
MGSVRERVDQPPLSGSGRPTAASIVTVLVAAASVLAGVGAVTPAAWGAIASVLGAVLGVIGITFLQARPRAALGFSFCLVLLADTKFRSRDATALLSGSLDAQIVSELAMYGIIALILLSVMLHSPHREGGALRLTSLELALLGYVLLANASVAWAPYTLVAAGRSIQLFILYALCFLAVRILGPGQLLRSLSLWAVAYTLLLSFMALVFPWANGTRTGPQGSQFTWFAVHPGVVAIVAATTALMMIAEGLFLEPGLRRRIKGVPLWWSFVPLVVILLAAYSRTAIFGFAMGALTLLIRKYLRPFAAGWLVVIVMAVLIASLTSMVVSPSTIAIRPEDLPPLTKYVLRGQTVQEFLGLSGRVELWQDVSTLVRERPVFGYGYTATRSALLEDFPWAGTAHGFLQEVLLNLGVVGAILLCFALARALLSAFVTSLPSRGPVAWAQAVVLGGFVFLLIDSVTSEDIAGPASYVLLLFLALVVVQGHLEVMAIPHAHSSRA